MFPKSVHPHGRGERVATGATFVSMTGSSPRAWGTDLNTLGGLLQQRFIPTGVGNGTGRVRAKRRISVHPHGRGERPVARRPLTCNVGSSPRAWGTDGDPHRPFCFTRFIPTGVGNGRHVSRAIGQIPVHPHGRGERGFHVTQISEPDGSSPRAWGTGPYRTRPRTRSRFIPTGVGNGHKQTL